MKILLIGSSTFDEIKSDGELVFSGGTEIFNHMLLNYLTKYKSGITIDYIAITGDKEMIDSTYHSYYGINSYKFMLEDKDSSDKFHDILMNGGYDLILISGMYNLSFKGVKEEDLYRGIKTPIMYFLHGVNCPPNMVNFHKINLSNPNIIFINSQKLAIDRYSKFCDKGRIKTIIYPVYLNDDYPELIDNSDKRSAFICARVCAQKGLDNAINLLKEAGYSIDLAGKIKMTKKGKLFYDTYIATGIVNYLGVISRQDIVENIRNHTFVVLLPNSMEGASLVLKESQFLGTPVITWNNTGLDVIIENNITFSKKKLARDKTYFIKEFLNMQDKVSRVVSMDNRYELKQKAQNLYSIDKFYKTLDNIINEIINKEN